MEVKRGLLVFVLFILCAFVCIMIFIRVRLIWLVSVLFLADYDHEHNSFSSSEYQDSSVPYPSSTQLGSKARIKVH
jgi:hypothetical protein